MSWRWPSVKIDSIRANTRYSLVGGPFGSNLTTRDYADGGVPVIRGTNLPEESGFEDSGFVFVTDDKANALTSNLAYPGDVVFTQRGTLGQVGIIPATACFQRYVISQSQMKLTVNEKLANARFVYYFFRHPSTVQEIKNRSITSGVPHINLGILKDFNIPCPPLHVQNSIVEILSAYDDLIENNRRRMALLEESARLLYREWFVRLRFPGYEHTPVVDGVPRGWERKTLGEVTYINQRSIGNSFDGEIEYIDIASVTRNSVNETTQYAFRDAPGRARRLVRHGDIIWSCVRPNRRSHAVIWQPAENLITSTGFVVISPKSLPTSFLYQSVTTDLFVGYLENHAKGAAYPAVVSGDFERAIILTPSPALATTFNDFAEPLLNQAHNLRLQNQKLRAARDLLLPRLMSGELAA